MFVDKQRRFLGMGVNEVGYSRLRGQVCGRLSVPGGVYTSEANAGSSDLQSDGAEKHRYLAERLRAPGDV